MTLACLAVLLSAYDLDRRRYVICNLTRTRCHEGCKVPMRVCGLPGLVVQTRVQHHMKSGDAPGKRWTMALPSRMKKMDDIYTPHANGKNRTA